MGLFDRWRRKGIRRTPTTRVVEGAKPTRPSSIDDLSTTVQGEIVTLVAHYERLVKQRATLQVERGDLTNQLDRGELTAIAFRKQLMAKIQEAAQVAENLRATVSRLTELGYRGVLH